MLENNYKRNNKYITEYSEEHLEILTKCCSEMLVVLKKIEARFASKTGVYYIFFVM